MPLITNSLLSSLNRQFISSSRKQFSFSPSVIHKNSHLGTCLRQFATKAPDAAAVKEVPSQQQNTVKGPSDFSSFQNKSTASVLNQERRQKYQEFWNNRKENTSTSVTVSRRSRPTSASPAEEFNIMKPGNRIITPTRVRRDKTPAATSTASSKLVPKKSKRRVNKRRRNDEENPRRFADEILFEPLPAGMIELEGRLYHKSDFIKTDARQTKITLPMVGFTIHVHNGKQYYPIKISEEMIGHRLGEFAITKKRAVWKKKDRR